MKETLKVCLLQADLAWEDIDANLGLLEGMLEALETDVDLVVLPETFYYGEEDLSGLFDEKNDPGNTGVLNFFIDKDFDILHLLHGCRIES